MTPRRAEPGAVFLFFRSHPTEREDEHGRIGLSSRRDIPEMAGCAVSYAQGAGAMETLTIRIGSRGRSFASTAASPILPTISCPAVTFPNREYFLGSGVSWSMMKNWLPLGFGAEFAIAT